VGSCFTCMQTCMHAGRYAFGAYLKDEVLQELGMLCIHSIDVVSRICIVGDK
jgi:hypothetical protein